jgi:hypothetical protein
MLRAKLRRPAGLFCLVVPLFAVQPGDIVKGVAGLAVATHPGAVSQVVLHGSPGLVLAVQQDAGGKQWTRVLAADGGSGWTSRQFREALPARISGGRLLELSDRSPDHPSISEGIETIEVPREGAAISGASEKPRVASLVQMMLPPRLNPFLMPWLEINSGSRKGWVVPSELELEWGEPARGKNLVAAMELLGMDGIVRAPFLGPVRQTLLELYSPPAPVLTFEDISSKPVSAPSPAFIAKAPETLVRISPAWVAVFSSSAGFAFSFSKSGTGVVSAAVNAVVNAVVNQGKPVIVRAASGDLNGDGRPELVIQLASIYGDGYTTALWIVNGNSPEKGLDITTVALGGSGGEPGGSSIEAAWWIDGTMLWIARADSGRAEYVRLAYGAVPAKATRQTAYAVIAGQFPSREAAEQRAIALTGPTGPPVQTFPWQPTKGPLQWAAGRLFRGRSAAQSWCNAAALPASANRLVQVSFAGLLPKASH